MDKATWLGLLVGFGGILFGNMIEGGHVSSLMQLTAFIIVLTGTVGAVLVSNSMRDMEVGLRLFRQAFRDQESSVQSHITEIVECSRIAKKDSILALEKHLPRVHDQFLRNVLRNVVDGVDVTLIRDIFETEIDTEEHELLAGAKIWTDAGGYSPTIGIIGAVLGLIHVMGNLADTTKLGAGIAVAFVATIYGVSFANLLFLPMGNKLKKKVQRSIKEKEVLLEGGLLIAAGLNPIVIEQKLKAFLDHGKAI
jgi:chemotaxis protein MotA